MIKSLFGEHSAIFLPSNNSLLKSERLKASSGTFPRVLTGRPRLGSTPAAQRPTSPLPSRPRGPQRRNPRPPRKGGTRRVLGVLCVDRDRGQNPSTDRTFRRTNRRKTRRKKNAILPRTTATTRPETAKEFGGPGASNPEGRSRRLRRPIGRYGDRRR